MSIKLLLIQSGYVKPKRIPDYAIVPGYCDILSGLFSKTVLPAGNAEGMVYGIPPGKPGG